MKKVVLYLLITSPVVIFFITICYLYVDLPAAVFFEKIIKFNNINVQAKAHAGIHMTLLCYLALLPCSAFYYFIKIYSLDLEKKYNIENSPYTTSTAQKINKLITFSNSRIMQFFRNLVLSLVFAYFIMEALKYFFGRPNIRTSDFNQLNAILHPSLFGFHFFSYGNDSFPSGHMTITSVVMINLYIYYNKFRFLYIAGIIAMAFVLLFLDLHYASDIIAGTYLGTTIALAFYQLYPKSATVTKQ